MSRFRIGGFAACSVLALVALMPGPGSRPLELASPAPKAQLGITSGEARASLFRVDPVSLKRSGRALELNGYAGVWAFAPDGRLLALAVRPRADGSDDTLRFFTVAGPRRVGRGVSLGGVASALTWVRPDRMLAYVNDCCTNANGAASILTIDPGTRRVVARTPIDGSVLKVARSQDSLLLLVAEANRIGAARLVVVGADGAQRSAQLDGIPAGMTWPDEAGSEPIGTRLIPGLTVDPAGNRAFVISPDGAAAEVELGSLAVSYYRQVEPQSLGERLAGWLTPPAEAKGSNGPELTARWLGDGLVAVAGSEESAVQEGGRLRVSVRPLGLRIVDTRDWSGRMLDAGADSFTVADGLLLATGSSWSSEPQTQSGMGIAAYGPDRARRFHLLPGRSAWLAFVYRGRAFVSVDDESALRIVDLASGQIVGARRADSPWPLLGESSPLFP